MEQFKDDIWVSWSVIELAEHTRMGSCLFRWGALVACCGWAGDFGNISENTGLSLPFISHQPLLFTVPLQGNRPTLNKIMFCGHLYEKNNLIFSNKSKQWMVTAQDIGTPLQRSHPRMLFGRVCLYLKTSSVEVIQTGSESLPSKITAISAAIIVNVNGLPLDWIRVFYDNRFFIWYLAYILISWL